MTSGEVLDARPAPAEHLVRAFSSDRFVLPLPDGHRFPMQKYRLLREGVTALGLLPESAVLEPAAIGEDDILRVHTDEYWSSVRSGVLDRRQQRAMGFPWSPEMVERSRRSVGATLAAARWALDRREEFPAGDVVDGPMFVGINLAGGTHHAFADRGEGFCVLNDVAIACRTLQAEERVNRALVIDCDVHQGNGTAALFAGDDTCFTLSLHGQKNYPFRKEQSDLDVALPDGCGDADYLLALEAALAEVERRIGWACRAHDADGWIGFVLAGADPYVNDRLGRLGLTMEGLRCRDEMIFDWCRRRGLAIALTMAGGYAEQVEDVAAIHLATIREAVAASTSRRDERAAETRGVQSALESTSAP